MVAVISIGTVKMEKTERIQEILEINWQILMTKSELCIWSPGNKQESIWGPSISSIPGTETDPGPGRDLRVLRKEFGGQF